MPHKGIKEFTSSVLDIKMHLNNSKILKTIPFKSAVQAPFLGAVLSPHKQLIFDESLGSGTQLVP